jgi:vacuolar protein 8
MRAILAHIRGRARAGVIAPLVALLSRGEINGVKEAATKVLGNLTVNADNKVAIARAGAISPLVALLSGGVRGG